MTPPHDAYGWLNDAITYLEAALALLEDTSEGDRLQGIITQVEKLQRQLA